MTAPHERVRIAAIDPGLDRVSVAHFAFWRTGRWKFASNEYKIRTLERVSVITSKPSHPVADRLAWIAGRLRADLDFFQPVRIWIEKPAIFGTYARRNQDASQAAAMAAGDSKMHRDLHKTHMASGALIATAATYGGGSVERGGCVELVPPVGVAMRMKKEARLERVRSYLASAGMGGKYTNGDDLDAIALGLAQEWDF